MEGRDRSFRANLGELREQAEDVRLLLLVLEVVVAQQASASAEPEPAACTKKASSNNAQPRGHLGHLAQRHCESGEGARG